jgi:hypothetical protein
LDWPASLPLKYPESLNGWINRSHNSGIPGVTSGILRDEDADCIILETSNGMTEYLMKTALIRIVPGK